ncbi:rod shape-determining protein MreC [Sphaerisporangium sp. NPDC051017]|uniref:rod shape-determining protein MreC n=1 Tax=Sphaerisporangium sp. NPDC051017 TaxID=3154636 RepID=UPI0034334AF1
MRDTRRARLILGLLLAAALVLITIDHRQRDDSLFEPVRGAAASLFGVAEKAGTSVVRPVGDFVDTFASAGEYKRQIAAVRAENARLRQELTAQTLDRQRSAQLTKMLGLSGLGGYHVVAAQVIARRGVPGFEEAVEIDAGSGDGVRPEMTVLNGDGLVGRVVHTSPGTSTVVLLTDPASTAGARMEGGNEVGVVTGLGRVAESRLIRFRLLDSAGPLAVGRRIVSFGSERGVPYVPGVPVGVIQRVEPTPGELTRVAYARPFVDFASLDVVGVVVKAPQRDPRDAMLPPPPKNQVRAPAKPAPPAAEPSSAPPVSPSPSATARENRENREGREGREGRERRQERDEPDERGRERGRDRRDQQGEEAQRRPGAARAHARHQRAPERRKAHAGPRRPAHPHPQARERRDGRPGDHRRDRSGGRT